MNTGLGFSEIILIVALVLMCFGSKELPSLVREAARLLARVRKYSDKVKRELNDMAQSLENVTSESKQISTVATKKDELRKTFIDKRKALTETERLSRSAEILGHLVASELYGNAAAVMVYVNVGAEVETRNLVNRMISDGKRVVVPFCYSGTHDLGIAEIRDLELDTAAGTLGIREPLEALRGKFFRSDLSLVVCPGVAFDVYGARLGRGKSYYDNFLRELKGRVPIVALAYGCQICGEPLPFDYHDISMDQIFTENGPLLAIQGIQKETLAAAAAESDV